MTTMNAVNSPSILHAEFVRLSIGQMGSPTAVYTFCNAGAPITVDGITFTALGAMLSVGDVQRDIKATSDDMVLGLTGIDPTYISLVLSSQIKGSIIEMWRGFLDSNNQIITTPTTQFFKRYQGIINNTSISEDYNIKLRKRVATCLISCTSIRQVLNNRISGIKTNINSWQNIYANDTSMNRVQVIQSTFFDFGAPPKQATVVGVNAGYVPSDGINGNG